MSGFDFLDSDDGAPENTVSEEEVLETEDSEEVEDTEEPTAETQEDEEEELLAVDLDGEETTLDQIREWKKGYLREQDYTKKSSANAQERKALEVERQKLTELHSSLEAGEEDIKKLLVSDLDDIDLKSLREQDYPEYLKVKETIKERESKFDEIKKLAATAKKEALQAEQAKVSEILGWDDSKKREQDIEAYKSLATDLGFTESDANSVTSAKVMQALVELATLKQTEKSVAKKAKTKKVKLKTSSANSQRAKPATQEERINSFFS